MHASTIKPVLTGRTIAVSESREMDVLSGLLQRRGAQVKRYPLVSIVDAPDPRPILDWLRWFIHSPPACLVLMTGEGLYRLLALIDAAPDLTRASFQAALSQTTIVARGPKPAKALRSLNLLPDLAPAQATTDGVIALLQELNLQGKSVGIQLYGDNPNKPLVNYLKAQGAQVNTVAPYRYASDLGQQQVAELIQGMASGDVDTVVFTSKSQVGRLFSVASELNVSNQLQEGLARVLIASVGPVVEQALRRRGFHADIQPNARFFMKPLVQAIMASDASLVSASSH